MVVETSKSNKNETVVAKLTQKAQIKINLVEQVIQKYLQTK